MKRDVSVHTREKRKSRAINCAATNVENAALRAPLLCSTQGAGVNMLATAGLLTELQRERTEA